MLATGVAAARDNPRVRYSDYGVYAWLRSGAPCRWRNATRIEFREVPLRSLQQAASRKDPAIVWKYTRSMQLGEPIAPAVVSETLAGTYFIHDGNHRCEALKTVFSETNPLVRVAVVVPKPGYRFRWHWFSSFGTYILEPEGLGQMRIIEKRVTSRARIRPLLGRTLVLVAHPDDETGGCAALLQRMHEPIIVFATSGAPDDKFFWGPYGSREAYGRIRKVEARRALNALGVSAVHFLEDQQAFGPASFIDQELHKSLPEAVTAMLGLVEMHRPDAILVPAYEGGHPDHDSCSFIGSIVGRLTSLPVWEMPLYHRSTSGRIVCRHFRSRNRTEVAIRLTASELFNRGVLISQYASQTDLGWFVSSDVETFRPQPAYDYTVPPHEGKVNYEVWGWPVSSSEVCLSFRQCASALAVGIQDEGLMSRLNMLPSGRESSLLTGGL